MSRPSLPRLWIAAVGCAVVACAGPSPVPAGGDALDEWLSRRAPPPASAPPADASRAPSRDGAAELVLAAMNFLDRPYRSGGQSAETGFDCSGFTRHVFGQALGIELPRSADEQAHDRALSRVSRDALRAGDLVFFNTLRRTFSHVGIYVGDGRFIHAPRSGAQIRVESLAADYWSRRFTGARRVAALADSGPLP